MIQYSPSDFIVFTHLILLLYLFLSSNRFDFKEIYSFATILFIIFPYYFNMFINNVLTPTASVNLLFLSSSIIILLYKPKYILVQLPNIKTHNINRYKYRLSKVYITVILLISSILAFNSGTLNISSAYSTNILLGIYIYSMFWGVYLNKIYNKFVLHINYYVIIGFIAVIVLYLISWSGYGRLHLAKILTSSLIIYSLNYKYFFLHKLFILLLIPIILILSGLVRDTNATSSDVLTEGSGLGSVWSPLRETERVFYDISNGNRQLLYGKSYVASFLFFIPREIWNEKPIGFGSQIVEWYMPGYFGRHSLAGTFLAEAFANFKFFGLLILLFLPFVHFKLEHRLINKLTTRSVFLMITFLVVILDFIWGGMHSAFIRGFIIFSTIYILSKFSFLHK